ncbi:MAG: hypothetical protein IJD67_03435, partial [Clostridia bacterium]|nr:hypothetical protein [Clostridia bacterium]
MNHTLKKLFSVILCLLMLFTSFTGVVFNEEAHFELEHMHLHDEHDGHDHEDHDEPTDLLALCKDALDYTISLIAIPVSADYEDGVECEYCGGWR